MDNNLSDQIAQVKQLARTRLVRYTNLDVANCMEVFLFENDMFCGIRFSLGKFQAKWLSGDSAIIFLRDGNEIDRHAIDQPSRSRAA